MLPLLLSLGRNKTIDINTIILLYVLVSKCFLYKPLSYQTHYFLFSFWWAWLTYSLKEPSFHFVFPALFAVAITMIFCLMNCAAQHYIANIEWWVDALGPQYNENTCWLRFKLLVTPLSCLNKAPSHSIKQYSDLIFFKSITMINSNVQSDQSQRSLEEPDSKSTQLVETHEGRSCFTHNSFHTSMSAGIVCQRWRNGNTWQHEVQLISWCLNDCVSWKQYLFSVVWTISPDCILD